MTFKFGKYKGRDVWDIPTEYLEWARDTCDLWPRLKAAVIEELNSRQTEIPPPFTTPAIPVLLEIVTAGRRTLALKYHPDHGGDVDRMQRVNSAADFLESHVKASIGTRTC